MKKTALPASTYDKVFSEYFKRSTPEFKWFLETFVRMEDHHEV